MHLDEFANTEFVVFGFKLVTVVSHAICICRCMVCFEFNVVVHSFLLLKLLYGLSNKLNSYIQFRMH